MVPFLIFEKTTAVKCASKSEAEYLCLSYDLTVKWRASVGSGVAEVRLNCQSSRFYFELYWVSTETMKAYLAVDSILNRYDLTPRVGCLVECGY